MPILGLVASLGLSVTAFTAVGLATSVISQKAHTITQGFVENDNAETKKALDNIEKRNFNEKLIQYL